MSHITLNYKQVAAIVMITINILIIGPGSWILNVLWHDATSFKKETQEQFKAMRYDIGKFKVDISDNYLTQQTFNDYREQMSENIRYLDNKISNNQRLSGSVE